MTNEEQLKKDSTLIRVFNYAIKECKKKSVLPKETIANLILQVSRRGLV